MDMITIQYRQLSREWVSKQDNKSLKKLRDFLDLNVVKMPKRLFNYSEDNPSTWLYKKCNVSGSLKNPRITWEVNEELWRKLYGKSYLERLT